MKYDPPSSPPLGLHGHVHASVPTQIDIHMTHICKHMHTHPYTYTDREKGGGLMVSPLKRTEEKENWYWWLKGVFAYINPTFKGEYMFI